jgi:hypothetical protein
MYSNDSYTKSLQIVYCGQAFNPRVNNFTHRKVIKPYSKQYVQTVFDTPVKTEMQVTNNTTTTNTTKDSENR